MPIVKYVEDGGQEHSIDVETGFSVMEGAVQGDVPGIDADCGGACACATCHVYIDDAWTHALLPPDDMEEAMLDCAQDRRSESRLSCQIKITGALDGLIVYIPENQR